MFDGRYIILVEDDATMGSSIRQRLLLEGADVSWVKQMGRGIAAIRTPRRSVDAVICDIGLPDGSGEALFETLCRTSTPPPFLFITGQGGIEQAVRLIRSGAGDYIEKPFEMPRFLGRLQQLLPAREEASRDGPVTGVSDAARGIDALVRRLAPDGRPVLIRGAQGLGKGRVARSLHDRSAHRAAGFLTVDLFRRTGGAGSLARALDEVGEGTLYLAGVGRLLPDEQDLLIGCLQASPGFRLIASCGLSLEERVAQGAFRRDLWSILKRGEIALPPLSARREDALWLAQGLLPRLAPGGGRPGVRLGAHAEAAILDHDWPGNGQEVRSRLVRALGSASGELLLPSDLFPEFAAAEGPGIRPLADARDAAERREISAALERTGGQVSEAARLLKVSRTTLWEKMQKLDL